MARTGAEPDARVLAWAPARLVFGQHVWCPICKGAGKVTDNEENETTCTHCGGLGILDRGPAEEEPQKDDTG